MSDQTLPSGATATAKLDGDKVVVTISDPHKTGPKEPLPPEGGKENVIKTQGLVTSVPSKKQGQ